MEKNPKRVAAGRINAQACLENRYELRRERLWEINELFEHWNFDLDTHGMRTKLARLVEKMISSAEFEQKVYAAMIEVVQPTFNTNFLKKSRLPYCRIGIGGNPIKFRTLRDDYLPEIYYSYTRLPNMPTVTISQVSMIIIAVHAE